MRQVNEQAWQDITAALAAWDESSPFVVPADVMEKLNRAAEWVLSGRAEKADSARDAEDKR